jgi:hypothetical protein
LLIIVCNKPYFFMVQWLMPNTNGGRGVARYVSTPAEEAQGASAAAADSNMDGFERQMMINSNNNSPDKSATAPPS